MPPANRIITAIDALPSAQSAAQQFRRLADDCTAGDGSASFCRDPRQTADRRLAEEGPEPSATAR